MFLSDAPQVGKPHRTPEGYLAVRAKTARTGIQDYMGYEIDPSGNHFKPDEIVPVYRPAGEVFDTKAVHSFLMKPITNDHPSVAVNRDNWSELSKGTIVKALRDGDDLVFDLILMDGKAIDAVYSGKVELSNGYTANLVIEDGITEDGKPYKAVQRNIRGNHIAIVNRGRAGPEYRILDSIAVCDANSSALTDVKTEKLMKITIGDAKDVDLADGAAVAVAVGSLNTALNDAQSKVGQLTAEVATIKSTIEAKDGEIAALNAKLADAVVTPEKLQFLADARASVINKAKTIAPSIVVDGKNDAEIRKDAVVAKLGDVAKEMSDAAIEGAFAALSVNQVENVQPMGTPVQVGDAAAKAHSSYLSRFTGKKDS